tara:strand:+ start:614 stop:1069 length:456 start_codon:yes stop_codon:yes gene_type:complete
VIVQTKLQKIRKIQKNRGLFLAELLKLRDMRDKELKKDRVVVPLDKAIFALGDLREDDLYLHLKEVMSELHIESEVIAKNLEMERKVGGKRGEEIRASARTGTWLGRCGWTEGVNLLELEKAKPPRLMIQAETVCKEIKEERQIETETRKH